jgi:hypothetical protein
MESSRATIKQAICPKNHRFMFDQYDGIPKFCQECGEPGVRCIEIERSRAEWEKYHQPIPNMSARQL